MTVTDDRPFWCHVDVDSLESIYEFRRRHRPPECDRFFETGITGAIEFFASRNITATFFIVARDLGDPFKRRVIEQARDAGHRIASHSMNHALLAGLAMRDRREEIAGSRARIEDALGVPVRGFRFPGYSLDRESLEIVRDAGYDYDSSMFANKRFCRRMGFAHVSYVPFEPFEGVDFIEFPLPRVGSFLPPFHPCYAFYLSRAYFDRSFAWFARRASSMTLLFHLTDFAEPAIAHQTPDMRFYANGFISVAAKSRFLTRLIETVRTRYASAVTEDWIDRRRLDLAR
ncbi:polysaccharide deacetylase family protein [bacterium]|nr:polysaccharide deacetylase family protein [bacterium]